ncbi:MAG: hypothetical protein KDK78_09080 [Chlamydiia bacterium]|nr:hypothetical protein [Chlamydiia bacterium]
MTSAETIRGAFLPLNKNEQGPHGAEFREEFCDSISGTTIRLRTVDGVELDAVWSPSQRPDAATVILTHGNGSSLDGNAPFAAWYHNRGFNVLLYTMRGYPGSGGDAVKDGEIGCYADMHAAVRFALAHGASRDKLLFHGYSFGGATAAAGAHFFGGHLTLDHTFTKPAAVAQNLLQSESSAVPFCIT